MDSPRLIAGLTVLERSQSLDWPSREMMNRTPELDTCVAGGAMRKRRRPTVRSGGG